jgi:hypothetical protein
MATESAASVADSGLASYLLMRWCLTNPEDVPVSAVFRDSNGKDPRPAHANIHRSSPEGHFYRRQGKR